MADAKDIKLGPWPFGMDNVHTPDHQVFQVPGQNQPPARLYTATDVNVRDDGWIETRAGVSQVVSATAATRLITKAGLVLYQDGTTLYRVSGGTGTSLITGLNAAVVAHEWPTGGSQLFVTDGTLVRRVVSGTVSGWGLAVPAVPTITRGSGNLTAGAYLVTTALRTGPLSDQSAHEGGAQPLLRYTLSAAGGLTITQAVTDTNATHVAFYVSRVNAPVAARAGVAAISAGTATLTISVAETLGATEALPLTLNWGPPPLNVAHLGSWQGFMLAAVGNALYRSWPGQPHLWWPVPMMLGASITTIVGLTDGFYVGTVSGLYWVQGGPDPAAWSPQRVEVASILPEGEVVPGGAIPLLEVGTPVALFASPSVGLLAGLPGGQVRRLTYNRYHFPSATRVQMAYSPEHQRVYIAST